MGTHKKQHTTHQTRTTERHFYVKEFGGRLMLLVGSFVVAAIVGFEFKDIIQTLVTLQLADLNMVNFAQAEGVLPTVQISLLAGVLGGLPFAAYHVYRFFAPILARGAGYGFRMIAASVVLLVTAVAYAFMVTVPLGLQSFVAASPSPVATQTFLTFVVTHVVTLALLSQLPLVIIFMNGLRQFSAQKFMILQASFVLAIFAFAIMATPAAFGKGFGGVLLFAAPVLVLFEAAMFWAKLRGRTITKQLLEEEPLAAETLATEEVVEHEQAPAAAALPAAAAVSTTPVVAAHATETPQVASEPVGEAVADTAQPTLEDIFDAMLADTDDEPDRFAEEEVINETADEAVFEVPQPARLPAPVPVPVAPESPLQAATYTGMPSYRPQPLPQPRPVARRQPAYVRPITDMLRPGQTSTPQLRSLHTPRQTIPFQATPAR